MALRAAIAKLCAGRVAERPAAHGLLQLDDGDPERHRQHDAFDLLWFGFGQRCGQMASAVAPRTIRARRSGAGARRGRLLGRRRRRGVARRLGTSPGRRGQADEPCRLWRCASAHDRGGSRSGWRFCPQSRPAEAVPLVRPSKTLSPRSSILSSKCRPATESAFRAGDAPSGETRTITLFEAITTISRGHR